jgi:AraC family transcriptional regulator
MPGANTPAAFLPLPARSEYVSSEVALPGLRCAEARYPAGLRLPEHAHENACLTVVLSGSVEESCRSLSPIACREGTLLVRPWGEPHSDRVGGGGVGLLEIELGHAWAQDGALRDSLREPLILQDSRLLELSRQVRREMRASDSARGLVLEGLALELLGAAVRLSVGEGQGTAPPRWLAEVIEKLETGFRQPVRFSELAASAGVHPVHLARAFRTRFGVSPGGYLRRLRVRWAAKALLEQPERPVAALASEAGFYDQSHFCRTFKALMGTTPSYFRRSGGGA